MMTVKRTWADKIRADSGLFAHSPRASRTLSSLTQLIPTAATSGSQSILIQFPLSPSAKPVYVLSISMTILPVCCICPRQRLAELYLLCVSSFHSLVAPFRSGDRNLGSLGGLGLSPNLLFRISLTQTPRSPLLWRCVCHSRIRQLSVRLGRWLINNPVPPARNFYWIGALDFEGDLPKPTHFAKVRLEWTSEECASQDRSPRSNFHCARNVHLLLLDSTQVSTRKPLNQATIRTCLSPAIL